MAKEERAQIRKSIDLMQIELHGRGRGALNGAAAEGTYHEGVGHETPNSDSGNRRPNRPGSTSWVAAGRETSPMKSPKQVTNLKFMLAEYK